jgi:hypothetical protein
MHSNCPDQPGDGGAPAASPLAALRRTGGEIETRKRRLLDLTLEALAWGEVQTVAGLTLQDYLVTEVGLDHWTATNLVAVAERLPALPEVADRYCAEIIGFDQLVAFVKETRQLNGQRLAVMDAEAASLADALAGQHRTASWISEVAILVEDQRAPGHLQRLERRRERDLSLSAQQDPAISLSARR